MQHGFRRVRLKENGLIIEVDNLRADKMVEIGIAEEVEEQEGASEEKVVETATAEPPRRAVRRKPVKRKRGRRKKDVLEN